MKTSELYKITLRGDNTKYTVVQCGEITSIQWINENGNPFWLTYKTKYVIQNLREGKWVRVLSKKAKASFKRSTLFSFDDLD